MFVGLLFMTFPHIGNARPLVVFDVLFRLLKTSLWEKIKLPMLEILQI